MPHDRSRFCRQVTTAFALVGLLTACGGERSEATPPSASKGQVTPVLTTKVSFYAASRFAEQASFGPTPALVAELQAKGFAKWIDDQFALPASQINVTPYQGFLDPIPSEESHRYAREFPNLAIAAPDQLRLRVAWSLSQFIVTSDRKGDIAGMVHWINLLTRDALGKYDALLYDISINPIMGQYLDNYQNRPKSVECPHCAPNENFARELMQLFSLGVFKLNPDGSAQKDSRGRLIETYTQRDVEEMARVLTGWQFDQVPQVRPNRNWGNWGKPMVPSAWPPERDSGSKQVLSRQFPAGQSQEADLRDAIAMLMAHPNIAPFVAVRMIQHLVKSDPSGAYVGRVSAVFRNNGQGVAGDMKAVVKAVLLDAEARAGDSLGGSAEGSGKIREPFLYGTALWRGLGWTKVPSRDWGAVALPDSQRPFSAESVFSFYSPYDRAPGSNLLAPEQRLLNESGIRERLSLPEWPAAYDHRANTRSYGLYVEAGCKTDELRAAFARSPLAFNEFLAPRFFRGAMPPTLRSNIEQLMREPWPPWNHQDPMEGALRVLGLALTTPYFGVQK